MTEEHTQKELFMVGISEETVSQIANAATALEKMLKLDTRPSSLSTVNFLIKIGLQVVQWTKDEKQTDQREMLDFLRKQFYNS